MRAGIPDQTSRERTITFYLDKEIFKQALDITSEESIQIFLVDKEGNILWQEEGLFNPEKNQSLVDTLSQLP
jgi:predicted transcriptional regulator